MVEREVKMYGEIGVLGLSLGACGMFLTALGGWGSPLPLPIYQKVNHKSSKNRAKIEKNCAKNRFFKGWALGSYFSSILNEKMCKKQAKIR